MPELINLVIWGAVGVMILATLTFIWDSIEGIRIYKQDREYVKDWIAEHPGSMESEVLRESFNRRYPKRRIE